jgi:molybdopterin-dependent oxidoreductase alpha subunit
VLDHEFLENHTTGLEELRAHLATLDEEAVRAATGLRTEEIDELAARYIAADRVIITWAMGLTQHKKSVDTLKDLINLLLLRGNIGKPGAGASPIRGHSNVQGDRTMGIWEQMASPFLDAIETEFGFAPPREHGMDALKAIHAMQKSEVSVFFALGGNFVAAISDTGATEAAMRGCDLTVQVSTKLNRSHAVIGTEALILPTLGRTEFDLQKSGPQFLSVEDTVCAVHATHGSVPPVAPGLLSEVSIITRLAAAVLGDSVPVDWAGFEADYDTIREHISRVIPGFEDFNAKVRRKNGFVLPNGPRDSRTFHTATGKAMLTVNHLEHLERPSGRLILQTMRSHDQFNTTIYSLNDRYRGIHNGRDVVFVNPDDLTELGLEDGQRVDIFSEWRDEPDRVLRNYRAVG